MDSWDGSFKASYDMTTRIVSGLVAVALCAMGYATRSYVVGGVAVLVVLAAWAWSPMGYSVAGGVVTIRRLMGSVHIPARGIREARVAGEDDFSGCIRLWGSGGLFGYYGLFRTSKLGKCTFYLTDRSHSVVLRGDWGTALVSPDDVKGFLDAVRRAGAVGAAGAATSPGAMFALSDGGGGNGGAVFPALIGLAAIGVAAAALLYSPGPPSYTLTGDALAIHDKFYPVTVKASSVDTQRVRVIDVNADTDWKPVKRTDGFGSIHYHAGLFEVAGGQTVRMYRADGTRLVLLPPKGEGTPVLVETRDPEGFVAEVRQKWGGVN